MCKVTVKMGRRVQQESNSSPCAVSSLFTFQKEDTRHPTRMPWEPLERPGVVLFIFEASVLSMCSAHSGSSSAWLKAVK